MTTKEKLAQLRNALKKQELAGYLQPVHDAFMSEYPPACYQRVAWLSGFTGSAGMAVVLENKAALFVDGRYTLQAAAEVDTSLFAIHNSGELAPEAWVATELNGKAIGYDPELFTRAMIRRMEVALGKSKVTLKPVANLIDPLWENRPAIPATPIFAHDDALAGESSASKCGKISAALKADSLDAALITAPDSLCWLSNLRARDVECTPLMLAHGLLASDGKLSLFVDAARLPAVPAHITAGDAKKTIAAFSGKRVLVDESQVSQATLAMLEAAGVMIVRGSDPCILPKACKNAVQLEHIRAAHLRDGVAVKKLLSWIENHPDIESVSEMEVADQLLAFRREANDFLEPSFPTIAGSGGNGAIVHYRATEKTNRTLKKGELLLLDSGGQYPSGTTDITRTIAIGTPSAEQKRNFTLVLKGHIALANAIFPKGTRGSALDALARQYLWQHGLDYDHGTGHGVGQFLGVHEGPQRIGKRGGDAELKPGMILSNEPGYYKTGEYGIRIENLVVVVEKENGFLGFETITCAPLDAKLIDEALLSEPEKRWLSEYKNWVDGKLA